MQERVKYIRMPQVREIVPMSKSTIWAKVKTGEFPAPHKLSTRITAWKESDIISYCEQLKT